MEDNPNRKCRSENYKASRISIFSCTLRDAVVTLKITQVNNILEDWRGLNATYDSNRKGRQRVRMQEMVQPKRSDAVAQTTETVERWKCDVSEYEQRRQDRCHPRTGTAVGTAPLPLELSHAENLRASQDDALRQLSGTGGRCRFRKRLVKRGRRGEVGGAMATGKARARKAKAKTTPKRTSTSQAAASVV